MRKSGKREGRRGGEEGGGGIRTGKKDTRKWEKFGTDTLFDLARKGRYLNQRLVGM